MNSGVSKSSACSTQVFWKNPAFLTRNADIAAVLIAVALPWSTSLVAIFAVVWLLTVAPILDIKAFMQSLRRPVSALPIAFFCLAVVGTLWSDAAWGARLYAISPTAKLLMLPVLFSHFERSTRGNWVFNGFLVSCTLLMLMSWLVAYDPRLALKHEADYGIPVKNYIDQSQEFALCAVALALPVFRLLEQKRLLLAVALSAVALSFIANMAFVTVSRTALVSIPVMIIAFLLLHLNWKTSIVALSSLAVLATGIWFVSPRLQMKTDSVFAQYDKYEKSNEATSVGLRLEFWRKSIGFFEEAPIVGHGTGSTRGLFEQAAVGHAGAAAEVIGNPHNQTLNVAVQWGVLGVAILYATWIVHLLMFRGGGFMPWIGLLVVIQNMVSSLFNSHLFDFHEGWMYVLGVGVAGGAVLKSKLHENALAPTRAVRP